MMEPGKDEEDKVTHPALLNDCFLGRMFDFLDVHSLKNCRQVCHKWNRVAGISFRKATNVKINAYEELEAFDAVVSRSFDTSSNTFRNFFFKVFEHELTGESLMNTCQQYRSTIKSIKIWIRADPVTYADPDPRLIAECLTSLPELTELVIEDIPVMQLTADAFNGLKFPKLRSCTLTSKDCLDCSYPESDFITSLLIACASTIKDLQLGKVSPQSVEQLFNTVDLKRLHKLKFGDTEPLTLPIEFINNLHQLVPNLNTFDYYSSTTRLESDEVRRVMEAMRYVPNIRLKGFVPANQLAVLPGVKQLELNLRYSGTMGELVKCLPNVETLHVYYASSLSDPWQEMKYLKELLLNGSHPTFHLASVSRSTFPSLTKLSIKLSTDQLTYIFASLPTLIELNILRGSLVTDEDLTGIPIDNIRCDTFKPEMRVKPYVGNLKHLRVLNIGSCFLSPKCIQYGIADVRTLTNLTMIRPIAQLARSSKSANRVITFRSIPASQNLFDLQPLFPPHLPYLVQFTLVTPESSVCPLDDIQLAALKKLRPNLYLHTESANVAIFNDPVVDFHLGMW